jgi:hypothetical protein
MEYTEKHSNAMNYLTSLEENSSNEAARRIEKIRTDKENAFKEFLFEGKKTVYDMNQKIPFPSKIISISSGRGGWELIKWRHPELEKFFEYESFFDPIHTNSLVNPIIATGYPLSSYMFKIETEEGTVKLIPKNPYK